MKLVIDADGCPVVSLAVKAAEKYGVHCVLVCDTAHVFSGIPAEIITVSQDADSADFRIVNLIGSNDIVVTQDYGLAAMCLAKNAQVLSHSHFCWQPSRCWVPLSRGGAGIWGVWEQVGRRQGGSGSCRSGGEQQSSRGTAGMEGGCGRDGLPGPGCQLALR